MKIKRIEIVFITEKHNINYVYMQSMLTKMKRSFYIRRHFNYNLVLIVLNSHCWSLTRYSAFVWMTLF